MNNLIFCSCSFHISHYPHDLRENEYYFCFQQLLRMIPDNFDIAICDNTITSINDLSNQSLQNILSNKKIKFFILNQNIGKENIGMGELDELIYVSSNVNFLNYDKVIYWTSRKIITNPWLFEKVNSMKKNALISNPRFLHLNSKFNFKYSEPTPNLFNDMFFCLKSNLMNDYVNYSKEKMQFNQHNNIGSEQNIYKFINDRNIDYECLDCLGLIKIDYLDNNEIELI